MKFLLSGDAPFGTSGYGNQLGYIADVLRRAGHSVDFYAWANLTGGALATADSAYYPRIGAKGKNVHFVAEYAEVDVVLTLQDLWPLPADFGEQLRRREIPWVAYFPIDGAPLMDAIVHHASEATWPVVYSRFGEEAARAAGVDVDYIPHAIDTETFRPGDRAALRAKHGFPQDAFVVSLVGTNVGYPSRKALPEAMEAFAAFQRRHPEALLYYHGNVHPSEQSGYPLLALAETLGIPAGAFVHVHQVRYAMGLPAQMVAEIHAASDVLLHPSMGEGFGLGIVEAQACGTPVITQDCSSMSELTVNGIAVPRGQRFWRPVCDAHYIPRVADIEQALEEIHGWSEDERQEHAARGVHFVHSNYSWPIVEREYWQPFFERAQAELAGQAVEAAV